VPGIRGVTLDVAILEEASFINPEVFSKVLLPLISMNNFAILGISTPSDEANYYSQLLDLKNAEGIPLFVTLRIEQACARCIASGKPERCRHKLHLMPVWRNAESQKTLQAIYANDADNYARENQGVVANSAKKFIFRKFVDDLRASKPYVLQQNASIVWFGIDPSGGGTQSHYAIVAMVIEGPFRVILGIDKLSATDMDQVSAFLDYFVSSVRKMEKCKGAVFCYVIEANCTYLHASEVGKMLTRSEYQPARTIDKDPKNLGRIGVFTTETEKDVFAADLFGVLKDKALVFCEEKVKPYELMCEEKIQEQEEHEERVKRRRISGITTATKKSRKQMQVQIRDPYELFFQELSEYCIQIKAPKEPQWNKYRVTYSGKGFGKFDDLIMALQIVNTNSRRTCEDPEFIQEAASMGWRLN